MSTCKNKNESGIHTHTNTHTHIPHGFSENLNRERVLFKIIFFLTKKIEINVNLCYDVIENVSTHKQRMNVSLNIYRISLFIDTFKQQQLVYNQRPALTS